MPLIKELIHIPERVHQGDFVLKLTEGVNQAEATLRHYVVTPQLARAFDEALGFVKQAVDSGQSKAAYLHGSFGAGKSHFMAILHLLLAGNLQARAMTELADAVARHGWVQGRKFLMVPYHMVGAIDMESAVFGQYADHVRRLHPNAPVPGFYQAESLFDDARRLRAQMGDTNFFAGLNKSGSGGGGWGKLESWDAQAFDAAMLEPPSGPERVRLVGDLINTYFNAYRGRAGSQESFVSFDEGLAIMSAHAAGLGYDGVILFLDELVLWLASHASDVGFVSREGTKLVKLVEATHLQRPIPLISFIARQRDLRELVGESLPGAIGVQFTDVLRHYEARFHKITLEDRNLPAIAQKRVLRPVSDEAREQLSKAFEDALKLRRDVLDTLLTSEADRDLFNKVYPFSPALVQALIAVSAALQRERTALKLMMQLLVDRRDDLELGQLIPVGDLWDAIAEGDEPFSDAMRVHFDNAKRLYAQRLLPMLEKRHNITWEAVRLGQADANAARALRNDARLLKTLLLAALVPEVESLKALTAQRLTALNHGTFRSPIPGQEAQMVLRKLRDWAGEIGEIKVGEDQNPLISIQITGVDLEPILRAAETNDNEGNRRKLIRDLLFNQLGLGESTQLFTEYRFDWRHTQREVDVVYENVRLLADDRLKGRSGSWTVVLDYPFDETNRTPQDDIARLNEYRGGSARTVVWLPSFLSPKSQQDLGRLVILDHILQGDRFEQYASHLSLVDRTQARALATNQRDSLRVKLKSQLEVAYGITPEPRDAVSHTLEPDQHLRSLDPTFSPRPPVGADLGAAFRDLLDQMLRHQYPAHPSFDARINSKTARTLWTTLQPALDSPDHRAVLPDPASRSLVKNVVPALKLGETGENAVVLDDRWSQHFLQCAAREDCRRPTVGQLRQWMDQPNPMGLPVELQDLVVLCFARLTNRHFSLNNGPYAAEIGKLADAVELREQQLPTEDEWQEAHRRAAQLFGLVPPKVLSAANVATLTDQVREAARSRRTGLRGVLELLQGKTAEFANGPQSARVQTARSAQLLLAALTQAEDSDLVRTLSEAELLTSAAAVSTLLGSIDKQLDVLNRSAWGAFRALRDVQDQRQAAAQSVLSDLAEVLAHDEHVQPLGEAIAGLQSRALAALAGPTGASTPAPIPSGEEPLPAAPSAPADVPGKPQSPSLRLVTVEEQSRAALPAIEASRLLQELQQKLQSDSGLELSLSWRLQRRKEE
jgi:hypothetical protein